MTYSAGLARIRDDGRQSTDRGQRTRDIVDGKYLHKAGRVTFEVARYDRTRPLVIGPTLAYSTYLGGSGQDVGSAIAVDASGDAYVTGSTWETES